MKTRALLAASAMLFGSFTTAVFPPLATSAYADAASDAQAFCEDLLRPNDPNSQFTTSPTGLTTGDWVNDGPPVQGDAAGDPYGVGIPTPSDNVFNGTYIRHGGSPNVWGGASSTLTYPQTGQLFNFSQDQTRTTTFGCEVHKTVPGPGDTEQDIYPPGLQSTGNQIVEHQTLEFTQEVITDDDFVVFGESTDVLICISPNNVTKGKPGTWTRMHGFTGSCTDASTAAGTSFIPSHNNPTTDAGISH